MKKAISIISGVLLTTLGIVLFIFLFSELTITNHLNGAFGTNNVAPLIFTLFIICALLLIAGIGTIRQVLFEEELKVHDAKCCNILPGDHIDAHVHNLHMQLAIKPTGDKWIKLYRDKRDKDTTILIAERNRLSTITLNKSQIRSLRDGLTNILKGETKLNNFT